MLTLEGALKKEVRDEGGSKSEQDENDEKLKKSVNKGAWGIASQKVEVQVSVERVQNFEEAFLKIKAATGIADIEELVRTFIKNEDQNFSLFNYVNEQTNEVEKLEEQIQQLREEEHKYAAESGEDAAAQKQVLLELEAKARATEASVGRSEAKCAATHRVLAALRNGVASIFVKIECREDGASSAASGVAPAVTEANMLPYLGLVEARCNEVLQLYAASQQRERTRLAEGVAGSKGDEGDGMAVAMLNVLGAGPVTAMGQDLIHVNPPMLDDESSDDGDDEGGGNLRPLTRDELKAKALNRMNRRGGNKQAAGARKRK
jgi:polyhydroxyalkanoate synthesis regulator phasin